MAIETTDFTPTERIFPWGDTGAPNPTVRGLRPLGELYVNVLDGVVPVPSAGDNQNVTVNVNLPDNFVYLFMDTAVSVDGVGLATADNWEDLASIVLFDVSTGVVPNLEYSIGYVSAGGIGFGTRWIHNWRAQAPFPTYMLAGGTRVLTRFTNLTNDDIASNFNLVHRFIQYTVTQQFDAGVNSPILTR